MNQSKSLHILFTISFFLTLCCLFPMDVFSFLMEIGLTVFFYKHCVPLKFSIPGKREILKFLGISLLMIPFYIVLAKQFAIRKVFASALILLVHDSQLSPYLYLLLALLMGSVPFVYLFHYWLVQKILAFFKTFSRREWYCFWGGSALLICVVIYLANQTSFWVFPVNHTQFIEENNGIVSFHDATHSVFFDSDTGYGVHYNVTYYHFRHPIYRLFLLITSAPSAFFYCVNHCFYCSGIYSLSIGFAEIQCIIFVLTGILLNRMLVQFLSPSVSFWIVLLWLCSFAGIWVYVPERTIPSAFCCVAVIYCWLVTKSSIWSRILVALLAIGTNLLSWGLIVLLALWTDGKTFLKSLPNEKRNWFMKPVILWLCFLVLIAAHCITNPDIQNDRNKAPQYISFVNSVTQFQKNSVSYLHFIHSCVFLPEWNYEMLGKETPTPRPAVRQVSSNNLSKSICWSGGFIMLAVFVSVLLWYREPFVQFAFLWFLVSLGILLIMGFGVVSESLALYTPYFSWAIVPLTFLWVGKLFPQNKDHWENDIQKSKRNWYRFIPLAGLCVLIAGNLAANICFVSEVTNHMKETYILIPPEKVKQPFAPKQFVIKYNFDDEMD